MSSVLGRLAYGELMVLFFIQAAGMAIWMVPLGGILDSSGHHSITAWAFATTALASFVSPLLFGAMADRHIHPARLLRGLATSSAFFMTLVGWSLHRHLASGWILALIQCFSLTYAPMFSISTTLVLARLENAPRDFGGVRALATLGWMSGSLLVGLLNLDRSPTTEFLGAAIWLVMAAFTFLLPDWEMPSAFEHLNWKERLGLDALALFRNRDIRLVFVTTTLFNIPLAAFYPYAPVHLHALGLSNSGAWMSLAQVSELAAMFSLGWLMTRLNFKVIMLCGLALGILRFALSSFNTPVGLVLGISLHGASYVLVLMTGTVYLNQKVDPAWRTRAQSLLALLNNGAGNLVGYLSAGFWMGACSHSAGVNWSFFWGLEAVMAAAASVAFLILGRSSGRPSVHPSAMA